MFSYLRWLLLPLTLWPSCEIKIKGLMSEIGVAFLHLRTLIITLSGRGVELTVCDSSSGTVTFQILGWELHSRPLTGGLDYPSFIRVLLLFKFRGSFNFKSKLSSCNEYYNIFESDAIAYSVSIYGGVRTWKLTLPDARLFTYFYSFLSPKMSLNASKFLYIFAILLTIWPSLVLNIFWIYNLLFCTFSI